jgi:hypothetical protein
MENFRHISLINCSFKIFSKVLTLRLGKIIERWENWFHSIERLPCSENTIERCPSRKIPLKE